MTRVLVLVATALTGAALPAADAWPGFRGTGDGVAAGDYPVKWAPKEGIAWKVDLPGYGQSSPVVWDGTVYLTAVEGEQREKGYVVALDAKTGKERWRHAFEPTQKAKWAYTISRGAPTPCADKAGVYCFFEGGNLIALDHAGKVRWERSLSKEYGDFQGGHGVGSSPAQTADAVFVLIDHRGPSYLLAVDKATGKNRWKTDREQRGGWASPVVATRGGKPEVIASSAGTIIGYAADTGKELWKLDGVVGNTLPSASVAGDRVLFGGGTSRSKEDAPVSAKGNGCLKLVAKDGKPSFETAWTAKIGISNYATPLGYEGVAYFVNQVGVVYAHDLATGKELFSERIDGVLGVAARRGRARVLLRQGRDHERAEGGQGVRPARVEQVVGREGEAGRRARQEGRAGRVRRPDRVRRRGGRRRVLRPHRHATVQGRQVTRAASGRRRGSTHAPVRPTRVGHFSAPERLNSLLRRGLGFLCVRHGHGHVEQSGEPLGNAGRGVVRVLRTPLVIVPLAGSGTARVGVVHPFHVHAQVVDPRDGRVLHVDVQRPPVMTHHRYLFVADGREFGVLPFESGEHLGGVEPQRLRTR